MLLGLIAALIIGQAASVAVVTKENLLGESENVIFNYLLVGRLVHPDNLRKDIMNTTNISIL